MVAETRYWEPEAGVAAVGSGLGEAISELRGMPGLRGDSESDAAWRDY